MNSTKDEKYEYKKHMCSLCDSLHENFGIKGRLFTNYDLTTMSVIAAALDDSYTKKIPESPKFFCTRFLSYSKPQELFTFFSAISVMLVYSREYDKRCENQLTSNPVKFEQMINIAENILKNYGLDKAFFEYIIQKQHQYENSSHDIEVLSHPTGEMISRILTVMCRILGQDCLIPKIQELGKEIGKLVYLYDGIIDYQKDTIFGMFNCISDCFLKNRGPSPEIADDIMRYISERKARISEIIDDINFSDEASLLKKILLKDVTIQESKNTAIVKNYFKGNSSILNNKIVYAIISGSLIVQPVLALYSPWSTPQDPCEWVQCICLGCCAGSCICLCGALSKCE